MLKKHGVFQRQLTNQTHEGKGAKQGTRLRLNRGDLIADAAPVLVPSARCVNENSWMSMNNPPAISVTPIGVVRSAFISRVGVPIQTASAPQVTGALEVFPAYAAGLRDLEGFEYVI